MYRKGSCVSSLGTEGPARPHVCVCLPACVCTGIRRMLQIQDFPGVAYAACVSIGARYPVCNGCLSKNSWLVTVCVCAPACLARLVHAQLADREVKVLQLENRVASEHARKEVELASRIERLKSLEARSKVSLPYTKGVGLPPANLSESRWARGWRPAPK